MKTKALPIGISDFKEIVTGGYLYVDKTLFIKEIVDRGDKIILLPRPRRFGKTLNLSMLKYFYDCIPNDGASSAQSQTPGENTPDEINKEIFDKLAIATAGEKYLDKIGKHPVIFLSFKGIKEQDWDSCIYKLKQLISDEYLKHDYLLDSPALKKQELDYIDKISNLKGNEGDYSNSLGKLLIFLNRHYGKRIVILIDEYDAPVHSGFTHGYYDRIIGFMRNFLCGGLKDTDQFLEKSVLSGIMRIAKESIFSGLNNPGVYTLLSGAFNDKFGFTQEEVNTLLLDFGVTHLHDHVGKWYNGYRFGGTVIYNPWSIINFLGDEDKDCKPFWINTSDNQIVEMLLSKGGVELKQELEILIRGESIEKSIDDNIVLKHLKSHDEVLWSFLLMGGYLKQTAKRRDEMSGKVYYRLSIPNMEVKTVYARIIDVFFADKIDHNKLEVMLDALVKGEIDVFEELFAQYVITSMSFFDTAAHSEPVYHAFVMGLLLWLAPTHHVKSNRESGYGRYDIMIIPKDPSKTGYVIEFKKVRPKETVETAVKSALNQIEEKKYETELLERGIDNIKKLAIVFHGKEVHIKEADRPSPGSAK